MAETISAVKYFEYTQSARRYCPCTLGTSELVRPEQPTAAKHALQMESTGIAKRGTYSGLVTDSHQVIRADLESNLDLATSFPEDPNTRNISQAYPQTQDMIAMLPSTVNEIYGMQYIDSGFGLPRQASAVNSPLISSHCFPGESSVDPYAGVCPQTIDFSQIALEEVPNIHPADFLALSLRAAKSILENSVKVLSTHGISSISYNTSTRTLKLRGSDLAAKRVRCSVEQILKEIYCKANSQYLFRPQDHLSGTLTDSRHLSQRIAADNQRRRDNANKTFALRINEDSFAVTTWMQHVLPSLPRILDPRIGKNYTASLVRTGLSEESASPNIRVQSPYTQSDGIRTEIREAVAAVCHGNGRVYIPLRFSTGRMTLLVGASMQCEALADIGQDDEDNEEDFPYFTRFWKNPGMGASIGMRCTRSVSATLGGHVVVDGQLFMLTVQHLIEESRQHVNNHTGSTDDLFVLTSPSLSDVDNMRADLEQSEPNKKADIGMECKKQFGDQDITLEDVQAAEAAPSNLKALDDDYEHINTIREELSKNDLDFDLGSVAFCSKSEPRETCRPRRLWPKELARRRVFHRMDWALCRVDIARQGENRHRYHFEDDPTLVNYWSDGANLLGDGEVCQETCELEPNVRVHYVGRRSGRQRGQVNAVPMLLSHDGNHTYEWHIIDERELPDKDTVAGDSGAWIIRETDNKLVGLLYGWNDGQLLFTPINDIFADIRANVPATEVTLPYQHNHPGLFATSTAVNAAPQIQLICEVKEEARKPRVWRSKRSRAKVMEPKPSLIDEDPTHTLSVIVPDGHSPSTNDRTATPSLETHETPCSPVPSLSFSTGSSPVAEIPSPERCNDVQLGLSVTEEFKSASSSLESTFRLGMDADDEGYSTANEQHHSPSFLMENAHKIRFEAAISKENRCSLQFILNDTNKAKQVGQPTPSAYLLQTTLNHNSYTFPLARNSKHQANRLSASEICMA
ncbi:MAG: hypothetical protein Q9187_007113 [Circinaria calcarea]